MLITNLPVFLTKEDHDQIMYHLRNNNQHSPADRQSAYLLQKELKRARLFKNDQLPPNVVRLGSRVIVRELETDTQLKLVIVTPERANWKEQKISVLSPLGIALIGLCRGVTVKWKVPAGEKLFFIEEVKAPL